MGKYRHVTDLRAFVSSLTLSGCAPLHLAPAADFRQRRGAAELPDPVPDGDLPTPKRRVLN